MGRPGLWILENEVKRWSAKLRIEEKGYVILGQTSSGDEAGEFIIEGLEGMRPTVELPYWWGR